MAETDKDLSTLDDPEDADEEEDDVDEAREAADQEVIDEEEESRPELVVTDADVKAARIAVQKVRALIVD